MCLQQLCYINPLQNMIQSRHPSFATVFPILVYTNDILGLRGAGDFSLQEPEKFPGKLKAITKQGCNHRLVLWGMWLRGQAGGGLSPFLFSCWKTYGKYDNFSQTWLMSVCILSVNRAGCVELEIHFPLTSHSPKDALGEWRRMLNYHGN